jgi:hypothetical protein
MRESDKFVLIPTMQPILLFCFFLSAYSLAVEKRSCVSSAVVDVSIQVSSPHYFCAWYLKEYGVLNFTKIYNI